MIKDPNTFDYSKYLDVENSLSSLEPRYQVYESYTKGKTKVYCLYCESCWV